MAYEKQTWAKGDIVTSAKLNHMEDGIADSDTDAFAINISCKESYSSDDYTDVSVKESLDYIYSSLKAGKYPIVYVETKSGAPYPQTYSFADLQSQVYEQNNYCAVSGYCIAGFGATQYVDYLEVDLSGNLSNGQLTCSVKKIHR